MKDRNVARDGGNSDNADVWGTKGHDERDRVIRRGVSVDQEGARHAGRIAALGSGSQLSVKSKPGTRTKPRAADRCPRHTRIWGRACARPQIVDTGYDLVREREVQAGCKRDIVPLDFRS